MLRRILISVPTRVIVLALLSLLSGTAAVASQTDWNVWLKASFGSVGGSPQDVTAFIGVYPGSTDEWDQGYDSKKPGLPMGDYVYTWFNRLDWREGPIAADFRCEIAEGISKRWGTAIDDTWNVKTSVDNGASGYFDPDCDPLQALEYPVAGSIYVTWEFGVTDHPPLPLPPDDYTFTLVYQGGVNPKPAGTKLPDAMDPPAIGTT